MEFVEIGKAVKLHGYLGELKIRAPFDDDFDVKSIKILFDDKKNAYNVSRVFKTNDGIVVALENVGLEQAKTFIGKAFFIDREMLAGKMLIEDLKGSKIIFENGTAIGKITDVQDFGAAEVIYFENERREEYMFPNVSGVIVSFDYHDKVLTLNEQKFRQVCDYEN